MTMTFRQFKFFYVLLLASNLAFGSTKTVDGGAGIDSLTISDSGITSLGDFSITTSGDYLVLTDSSSNSVNFKNISTLTVGSYEYIEDTSNDNYWNATEKVLYMYDGGGWGGT